MRRCSEPEASMRAVVLSVPSLSSMSVSSILKRRVTMAVAPFLPWMYYYFKRSIMHPSVKNRFIFSFLHHLFLNIFLFKSVIYAI